MLCMITQRSLLFGKDATNLTFPLGIMCWFLGTRLQPIISAASPWSLGMEITALGWIAGAAILKLDLTGTWDAWLVFAWIMARRSFLMNPKAL